MRKALLVLACLAMAVMVASPAMAYVAVDWENFYMQNGPLNGQIPGFSHTSAEYPTWGAPPNPYDPDLTAAGSEISVLNHTLRVSSNTTGKTTTARWVREGIYTPDPARPTLQFWARKGGATGANVPCWRVSAGLGSNYQTLDRAFGKWDGNGSTATCYDPLHGTPIVTVPLTDQWQCFTIVGDGWAAITCYYVGNTMVGYGPCWANTNPRLQWVTVNSYSSSSGSSYVDLGNFSYGVTASYDEPAMGSTRPSPEDVVVNFKALEFNGQVGLSWINSSLPSFAGTMIRCKTTGYPTGPTDGMLVCDKPNTPGSSDSFLHTGLANGVTYYYSAFTYDSAPTYNARVCAKATPRDSVCWHEPFEYADGPLVGQGGWTGQSGAGMVDNQALKIVGDGDFYRYEKRLDCQGWNGIIWARIQVKAGSGTSNMWDFWINDAAGYNLARWYGSGTSVRPRIGSTDLVLDPVILTGGWDNLDVKINTATNVGEFFFNGVSLGTLSHISTGAGDSVGGIWLGRQSSANMPGDYVLVDNISIGGDAVPPAPVTGFTTISGDCQVSLSWTNPSSDLDYAGMKIICKTTGYPTGPNDGMVIYTGTGTSFIHSGLTNETRYYYAAYAFDLDPTPNYSDAAFADALPTNLDAPGPVTALTAISNNGQVSLSWTNPSAPNFVGTMIRCKTTGFPTGPTDGTLVCNRTNTPGSSDSYLHTGLTNGLAYYYSAFAYDAVPRYSAKTDVSASLSAALCLVEPFSYPDGYLDTNGEWTGPCDAVRIVDEVVQVNSAAVGSNCIRPLSCYGIGGVVWVRIQAKAGFGSGPTCDILINDAAGNNFARWYGSPTSMRPRIGGTNSVLDGVTLTGDWDTLEVKIDTNTLLSEFFFNGVSLGTLDYSDMGAQLPVGQVTIASRDKGSAGNYVWLDNLVVGGDIHAPGPVTSFQATSGDGGISLSWTNPSSDFFGTMVVCKTTGYPEGPTDGTVVYAGPGSSCVHNDAVSGMRYYYAAYAYDAGPNYSTGATASAYFVENATIRQAKGLADGQVRALRGNIVSAKGAGFFYLQDPTDLQGIKVIGSQSVSEGARLDVIGTIGGQGSERWIDCSEGSVDVMSAGPFALDVPGLGLGSVGGTAMNGYTPGVVGGVGPNTIGLLVRAWGKVTQKDKDNRFFYIDDGSGLKDGTQTEVSDGVFQDSIGVRVSASGSGCAAGQYLAITGVISTFDSSGLRPQIVPQAEGIRQVTP